MTATETTLNHFRKIHPGIENYILKHLSTSRKNDRSLATFSHSVETIYFFRHLHQPTREMSIGLFSQ